MFFKIKIVMTIVGLGVPLKKKDMEKRIGEHTFYSDGRIYGHFYGKFLEGSTYECDGYNRVEINGKIEKRHKLIASIFIPIPDELKNIPIEKLDVHHKDENKTNNDISNLCWMSHKDHMALHRAKKVAQYTPYFPSELIKVWNTAKEAEKELRKQGYKINASKISAVCRHKRKTAGGFGWAYWEE